MMFNNHPHGTISRRDISRNRRASDGSWRTRDGERHPVTIRQRPLSKWGD